MPRQPTFNFIPAHQIGILRSPEKVLVSYSPKSRQVIFSRRNPEVSSYPGKIVQLYADEQKGTLAWTFLKEGSLGDLKHSSVIKLYGKSVVLQIPSTLAQALGMTSTLKRVEVMEYRSTALLDNNHYHYISVKKEKSHDN